METIRLLTTREVAELTGIPESTLRYYRHLGTGPKSGKLQGRVVYREHDVLAWIRSAFGETA